MVTDDDDFLDTIILDKPRDPKKSQLPSPNDTRSSVWTADERLVNPQSPLCNCFTHIDGRGPCCSRVFRRPHKMGNSVTKQLFHFRGGDYVRYITDPFRSAPPKRNNGYRDIVLVRDFYAAIISGYLYHKSGHECWSSPHGEPMNGSTINAYWMNLPSNLPIVSRRNRSICTYMAEESLSDGLLLWTDVARRWWLQPLVDQWNYAHTSDDKNRTLFVCYHDLVRGPPLLESTMRRILEHFFPGGHDYRAPKRLKKEAGGHAADKNRTELYAELERIDKQMFSGQIAAMCSPLPCPNERGTTVNRLYANEIKHLYELYVVARGEESRTQSNASSS